MSEEYGPAPLTFGQLAVWRDVHTLPRSRWHEANGVFTVDVPPEVSELSVHAALDRLAERHGALRTTYEVSRPEHPTQSLREVDELPLDFEAVTLESAEAIAAASAQLKGRPFDLRSERPYRALLVNTPGARTLLIGKHHIALDLWSMDLLTDELTTMFNGDDALRPPSENLCLLALEQYSATWQRRREASERHFRKVLSMPAARFRKQDPAHDALLGYFESARLHVVANELARQAQVSLSTVIISAFARAVSQLCTEAPIRLGLVSSNRYGDRWANLVSSMNQMILIPLEPGENCMGRPALEALQLQSLRAYRLAMYDDDRVRPATLGLPADTDPEPTCLYNIYPDPLTRQSSPIQDGDLPEISWTPVFHTLGPPCFLRVCETKTDANVSTLTVYLRTIGLGEAATVQMLQATYSAIIEAASVVVPSES